MQGEADYKRGAIHYTEKLTPDELQYLYTKPFGAGSWDDCAVRFQDFAHMLRLLKLDGRRRILDVGCGPGWLSEYLARLGYHVTGIDISPAMVRIARERAAAVKHTADRQALRATFQVADAEVLGLPGPFHAAVLYDTLHHFEDKPRVLANVFRVLAPRGRLLVYEGVRPPSGSAHAQRLEAVMRKYETLEDPVEPSALVDWLKAAGYVDIACYTPVNGLLPGGQTRRQAWRELVRLQPAMNIVLAAKPGDGAIDSRDPQILRAEIALLQAPPCCRPDEPVELAVRVTNTGDTLWLADPDESGGFVTLGGRLLTEEGDPITDALPRTLLGGPVAPGETVDLRMSFRAPAEPGRYSVRVDMVDEFVAWFEDRGSRAAEHELVIAEAP